MSIHKLQSGNLFLLLLQGVHTKFRKPRTTTFDIKVRTSEEREKKEEEVKITLLIVDTTLAHAIHSVKKRSNQIYLHEFSHRSFLQTHLVSPIIPHIPYI